MPKSVGTTDVTKKGRFSSPQTNGRLLQPSIRGRVSTKTSKESNAAKNPEIK